MVNAAFVAPFLLPATVRFVATAAQLPGVRLGLVTTAPAEQVPPELARHLAAHWRVDDALDPRQIADAVAGLSRQLGRGGHEPDGRGQQERCDERGVHHGR